MRNLKKNVKCLANVFTEKEYVDTIPFPYKHICVISGIEIMKKEFDGLVKERLRLDPTQDMSKLYNSIRYFLCKKEIWNIYVHICKNILIFYTLNK